MAPATSRTTAPSHSAGNYAGDGSTSLRDLVSTLGPLILSPITDISANHPVCDAVVYDPADTDALREGSIVLGVGIDPSDRGAAGSAVIERLQRAGCAALILKGEVAPVWATACDNARISLITCPPGTSWARLLQLLHSAMVSSDTSTSVLRGVPFGDLFALANAVSAVIDAPVTIEDRQSWVLAYSGRQDEADAARTETIVGRRIPDSYMRELSGAGIFSHLATSDDPIYWAGGSSNTMPRLVVAVRAGGELLGSLWAAIPSAPDHVQYETFREASRLVALHLLRHRTALDASDALQPALASRVLLGAPGAQDAAARLGIAQTPMHVVGVTIRNVGDPSVPGADAAEGAAMRKRLRDSLSVHLSAMSPRTACTELGGMVYALFPADRREAGNDRVKDVSRDFLRRGKFTSDVMVAVTSRPRVAASLSEGRQEVDEVLRAAAHGASSDVLDADDMRLPILLLRLTEAVDDPSQLVGTHLRTVSEHDASHGTSYLSSVRAYLDHFGDTAAAAAALHIHKNSLRYRIRRCRELFGLDLSTADGRLSVMLQLRLAGDTLTARNG